MNEYSELKRLAEASAGEWYKIGELRYEDRRSGDLHGLHHDDERFIEAASPATFLALIAENEALRKDAERYRFLRDDVSAGHVDLCIVKSNWKNSYITYLTLEQADYAIDAAMANHSGDPAEKVSS